MDCCDFSDHFQLDSFEPKYLHIFNFQIIIVIFASLCVITLQSGYKIGQIKNLKSTNFFLNFQKVFTPI